MADIKVLLEQSNCFSSAAQAAFNANLSKTMNRFVAADIAEGAIALR
jgi:hypothetical protein